MKKNIITVILISCAFFSSTRLLAQYSADSCGCGAPADSNGLGGGDILRYEDLATDLSPNGKLLAIGNQYINLGTLKRTSIVFNAGFPKEEEEMTGRITWCPYDSDIVAILMNCSIDTTDSPDSTMLVTNLFIYHISTGEATRITPTILGKYGPFSMSLFSWLSTSSPGKDSLVIGYSGIGQPNHQGFLGLYSPQTQSMIPVDVSYVDDTVWSSDSKHYVWWNTDTTKGSTMYGAPSLPFYYDNILLNFPEPLDTTTPTPIEGVTFSPNDSLIAYWVNPIGTETSDTIFQQVWVCKTSDPANIIDVINFQCCFCTYSFAGICPVFVTDSTLAVSMHHDGDESSPLWEISIDGCHIVRQLTFLPEYPSDVAEEHPEIPVNSIKVLPNPSTGILQILGGKAGTVRLFDILGRERIDANDDGSGASLDVSRLEPGIYFLRLGNQSSKVEIAR